MLAPDWADRLAADPRSAGRITLPARAGATAAWPQWLDPEVRRAYERVGIRQPWTHQVRTADLAWAGRHVLVATGTASGKSAAFGMPALTAALAAPSIVGRRGPSVLYLSPTKALAHDQLSGLLALGLPELRAAAIDGDTPGEARAWARSHARWVVTNPDMLHHSILPRHQAWRGLLRSLAYVIVDEAHIYRGVFGSHVALVLRRLQRVAAIHGATPTFIAASATVADPGTTAARLLGVEAAVVDSDRSSRGAVDIVLWNPLRPVPAEIPPPGKGPDAGGTTTTGPGRLDRDPPPGSVGGRPSVGSAGIAPSIGLAGIAPFIGSAGIAPSVGSAGIEPSMGLVLGGRGARLAMAAPSTESIGGAPAESTRGARAQSSRGASSRGAPSGGSVTGATSGEPWSGPFADPDPHGAASRGTLAEAADLMIQLVDRGTSTLAFARSRRAVEVLAGTVRERAVNGERVRGYRGGYLPEERRALEADLRSGRLLGLAATNALELGIDISGLDAVLLVGWPGTRSSFWQQVGRAGRRGGAALAVLIAREDPLDQYIVSHPETLTGRPVEASVLDPGNPYVLAGHLCAAAAEAPLLVAEVAASFGPGASELCTVLAERGLLRRRRDAWYWTDSTRATDLVDLRGAAGGPVRVVEHGTGRLLGTVEPDSAPSAVHEGALYVHQGATFEVVSLDLDARVATALPTITDLSTHALSTADVAFGTERSRTRWGQVDVACGEVVVTRQVTAYLLRRWPSGEVLAEHPLDLPPRALRTTAMWWSIPDDVLRAARIDEVDVPGAVHALEHASIGILPLLATCDRWDIGGVSTARHPQTGQAVIVVHDGHPGGAGFAERGFHRAADWLAATSSAIRECPCATGCPACVQSPKCGNRNEPLDKGAALRLADALLIEHDGPDT